MIMILGSGDAKNNETCISYGDMLSEDTGVDKNTKKCHEELSLPKWPVSMGLIKYAHMGL